ncbi:MAG: DNA topoisomerase (ATP-hydrolyzing) subunit B [Parcubacteria group bacterium]|nr:DNA topoisomerase (ATP-hydrolyzing) subunit B [Parcubacteria group bacterium]
MTKLVKQEGSYTAKDIYVLEGLEPVRKRPGMYIGSTGVDGLHHLIWEVFDNSLDEAMAGYAKNIEIALLPGNKVRVKDNGRGIPVEKHAQTKKSALETVMTTLHAGGKFGGESYKVSGGLHGVGVSVVNALSVWLKAEVSRDGFLYEQEYERGKAKKDVKKVGKAPSDFPRGTIITFEPDPEIFKEISFDFHKVLDHLRQQAYLTKGIHILVTDERSPIEIDSEKVQKQGSKSKNMPTYGFYFEGGIVSYVGYLNRNEEVKNRGIFYAAKEKEGIFVEIAMQYTEEFQSKELSFANNIYNLEGGMHLTGFRTALTRTLNDYARKNSYLKEKDENLTGEDVREGLTAVISVKIKNKELQFEGQTKAKLGNPEARTAVDGVLAEELADWLERSPQDAKEIMEKVILASKARVAAKAARDTVIRKGAMDGLALPGKLADCSSRDASESELFIVEGDSAGGSSKQARDRRTQAILPLFGKILNVERTRIDKLLASDKVRALIIALGTAIGEEFDLSKLRYHKLILMADADVDGSHIRTLYLTLFFRYFKSIIEQGHLYIAQPPLYKIQKSGQAHYAYNDQEKEKILSEIAKTISMKKSAKKEKEATLEIESEEEKANGVEGGSTEEEAKEILPGVTVQRYKGLGEMNSEELWETTMDPARRVLLQVTMEDAEEADRIFDVLMGNEVLPRKKFIQAYAKQVRNLDI